MLDVLPFLHAQTQGRRFIEDIDEVYSGGLDYIAAHPEVRDVILSGGDPLTLTDFMLEKILKGLREIPHVEIIRLGYEDPLRSAAARDAEALRHDQEVSSDLCQYAF